MAAGGVHRRGTSPTSRRHSNNWQQFARLKPGATRRAGAEPDRRHQRGQPRALSAAAIEILNNARLPHATSVASRTELVESSQRRCTCCGAASLFVLLIGCVNIANLVLDAVERSRVRELATRHALGASIRAACRGKCSPKPCWSRCVGGVARPRSRLVGAGRGRRARARSACRAAPEIALELAVARPSRRRSIAAVGVGSGCAGAGACGARTWRRSSAKRAARGTASRRTRLVRRAARHQPGGVRVDAAGRCRPVAGELPARARDRPGLRADARADRQRQPARGALRRTMRPCARRPTASSSACAPCPVSWPPGFTTTLPFGGQHSDSVIFAEGYQTAPGESLISPSQVVRQPGLLRGDGRQAASPGGSSTRGTSSDAPTRDHRRRAARAEVLAGQDPLGQRMYFPDERRATDGEAAAEDQMMTDGRRRRERAAATASWMARASARSAPTTCRIAQSPARSLAWRSAPTQTPEAAHGRVRREIAADRSGDAVLQRADHGGAAVDVARGSAHADDCWRPASRASRCSWRRSASTACWRIRSVQRTP